MRDILYWGIDLVSGSIGSLPILLILYSRWGCRKSRDKMIQGVLFVLYISLMFLVVGIPSYHYIHWSPNGSLIPFRDYYISSYLYQSGMNIIMFLPFGFLLPVIWKRFRSLGAATLAGALTSLTIEVMQLFCVRATDIDDLMMNTVGAFLGCVLARFVFGNDWWKEEKDPAEIRRREQRELFCILLLCLLANILVRNNARVVIYRVLYAVRDLFW